MPTNIFQIVGTSFDNATATFITSTANRIISDFAPLAITGVGLFFTCYGYLIMSGRIQEPFQDFILKCAKIIIISGLALNSPTYLNWVVSAINGLQSGLAAALGQTDTTSTIYQTLDKTLDAGMELIATCVENGRNSGWTEFGDAISWYINAALITGGTLLVVITGGVMILIASMLLKIMLAIGPLFIMCLMWPITAKFFDAWFSQTITYVLKTVLVATIMAFAVAIFTHIVGSVDLNGSANKIIMMLEILVASYLLYKITIEAGGVASGLAGGVSAAAMSIGQLAAAAMSPISTAKSIASGARNIVDPVKTRRDLQSGMLASDRRSGHLIAGNTMLNPAYRQRLLDNIGKNWGSKKGGSVKNN